MDRRRARVLRHPRASSVRNRHTTVPTPDRASLPRAPPLLPLSARLPTSPGSTRAYHTLTISAPDPADDVGVDVDEVVGRVKPSKCLPTEVERIEPARRRVVSSKCGHAAFCLQRESANDFVHNGLSGSTEHAWACDSWGGRLDERERGEASDPTV